MNGWERMQLCSFLSQRKEKIVIDPGQEYSLVTISNRGNISLREKKMGALIGATNGFIARSGDFIFSRLSVHTGAFGIVPLELEGALITNEMPCFQIDDTIIIPNILLDALSQPDFLWQLKQLTKGVGRVRIKEASLLALHINVPSLEEQREIEARLNSLKNTNKEINAELTHQQTLLKKLRQQILQEAIEGKLTAGWRAKNPDAEPASELLKRIAAEKAQLVKDKKIKAQKPLPPITDEEKPFELPQGWEWCRLDQLIYESPRNGYSPKTVDFPTGIRTLKLGATTKGEFDAKEIKFVDESIPQDSYLWIKARDILIQRGNSIGFVGVSAIYYGEDNGFIYPDLMMKLRPVDSISEVYLHHALMSVTCREYFRKNASGAQKSMPKINQSVVSGALVPLCSEAEQKAIVTKVEKLLALCDQLETQVTQNQAHAEQLMQAVLKEAFGHNREAAL